MMKIKNTMATHLQGKKEKHVPIASLVFLYMYGMYTYTSQDIA